MILAVGLVGLTACQEGVLSLDELENDNNVTYILANEESSANTKASISGSDASFTWNTKDQIAVYAGGYKISDALGSAFDGTNAATFAFSGSNAVTEANRADFAIFPASLVWDGSAIRPNSATNHASDKLTLTLPDSYTLEQVQNEVSPCPMIATNTPDGDLSFKYLCALLRVTVSNVPATTRRLVFVFNGKKVQGEFTLTSVDPGNSSIETVAAEGTNNTITVLTPGIKTVSSLTVNLPLPTGKYDYITISAYDRTEGGLPIYTATRLVKSSGIWESSRLSSRKISTTLSQISFSVSSTKKVLFAPGNLQYLGKSDGTGTWRFAEHQYDFMGDGPNSGTDYQGNVTVSGFTKYNASADKDVARDLFGWGTSGYNNKYPYITSKSSGSYYSGSLNGTDYDWGVYHSATGNSDEKIINGGDYSWRLFTAEEWSNIIARQGRVYTRTDYKETKSLFAPATVMGVKGIILFPDNWDGALYTSIKYGNSNGSGYTSTICDAEKWTVFENQGCVFLPAAHVRSGNEMDYLNNGHYWAGTVFSVLNNTEFRGGSLDFGKTGTVTTSSTNNSVRRLGQSVRLIRDVE